MRPITTKTIATSMAELVRDTFKIIGIRSHSWKYMIPESEIKSLRAARDAGRIITVQGQHEGFPTLYAKLAAV